MRGQGGNEHGGSPRFQGGVEPGRAPAGEGRELLTPWGDERVRSLSHRGAVSYYSAGSIGVENANDAGEVACDKPEAQAKPIVPLSAAPSRPVNFGSGDLVLLAAFLHSGVW